MYYLVNQKIIKYAKLRNCVNDLTSIGCKLFINIPTRFAENCKSSLLDHVNRNTTNKNMKSGICIFEISDHFPTFLTANRTKNFYNNTAKFKRSCMTS